MLQFLLPTLVSLLRGLLLTPEKMAKYARWALQIRDLLLSFFPLSAYPPNEMEDPAIAALPGPQHAEVPHGAVKEAARENGFNIPFIRGI